MVPFEADPITPEFIEAMVDRIISSLTKKLEELDISMDYIAAALLDTDAVGIGSTQAQRGRMGGAKSHLGVRSSRAPIASTSREDS